MKEHMHIVNINDFLYLETGLKTGNMIPTGYTQRPAIEAPMLPLSRYYNDLGTKQVSYGMVSGYPVNPSHSWKLVYILSECIPS